MYLGIALAALMFLVPATAVTAQEDSGVLSVDSHVEGDVDTLLDIELEDDVSVMSDDEVGVDTTMTADLEVEMEDKMEMENEMDESSHDEASMNAESDAELQVNGLGVAITSASQVSSDEDLGVFSANLLHLRKSLAKVSIDSDSDESTEVVVVYRHRGKLFGFIPVTVKSTTIVDTTSDGEVMVGSRLPWWSFLVAGENYAKEDLETRVKENATIKSSARASMSASSKAQLTEAVLAEIEAHAQSQTEAKLDTSTE